VGIVIDWLNGWLSARTAGGRHESGFLSSGVLKMGPSRSENALGLWLPPKQQGLMRFLINAPAPGMS